MKNKEIHNFGQKMANWSHRCDMHIAHTLLLSNEWI